MNTRTASRAHAAGVITALCIALAGAPAAGLDLTGREILATGDVVDGFGRIGVDGVAAQGIDGRGRLAGERPDQQRRRPAVLGRR